MTTPLSAKTRETGLTGRVYTLDNGCKARKRVIGYAYPKNGNHHNPSPSVVWEVVDASGKPVGTAANLRGARELASMHKA